MQARQGRLTTTSSNTLPKDLLITARVNILNDKIQPVRCPALLDTGSSINFIIVRLVNSLRLPEHKCSVAIGCPDTLSMASNRSITATITCINQTYRRTLTFRMIPTISTLIPDQSIDQSAIPIPRNIQLADPAFHLPAPIDILLRSELIVSSLCVGQVDLNPPTGADLRLQKTRFRWVIGRSPHFPLPARVFQSSTTDIETDLARFWERDEGLRTKQISEADVKNIFKITSNAPAKGDTSSHSPLSKNLLHSDHPKQWR